MTKIKSIFLALLVVLSPMAANADPVVDTNSGSNFIGNDFPSPGNDFYNQFTTGPSTGGWLINFVSVIWGPVVNGGPTVSLQILSDAGDTPGSLVATLLGPSNSTNTGYWWATYVPGSPLILAGGTSYWLNYSVANGSRRLPVTDGTPYLADGWSLNPYRVSEFFGEITVTGNNYLIIDAAKVPEPGTLALLGLGLVGMAARRRKTV